MKCIHVNAKKVLFILLTVITNNIYTAENQINSAKEDTGKEPNNGDDIKELKADLTLSCPADKECVDLPADCISCPKLNDYPSCIYGEETNVDCQVLFPVKSKCLGASSFQRSLICRYCYQTDPWEHSCDLKASCNSVLDHYTTNCTVKSDILCYGHRMFNKKLRCNWTGGYKWFTALALSVTLGGFGADRFYLGHWQEGIGKLFSFGGLGVWTLIDVILISLHYLGPADGSLYL